MSICNGFPFAYQRGIEDAKDILEKSGTEVIEIPICDETRFEKVSEIEINPNDEFGK